MLEIYWGCLIVGVLFAIVSVVFGDFIGQFLDGMLDFLSLEGPDFFHPMVIIGGITAFGGIGILLTEYTFFSFWIILLLSFLIAIFLSILVYFFYVKPMQNAENSTSYSIQELSGKIGEVTIPIPREGYGEVVIKVGLSNTNQIAASFDREEINSGTRVVVVQVKEDTLFVSRFEKI
ncbi:NfeD family protein [Ammoniphilus resinae]|uniref:Membrane protein implicated in regulation of membrane protease activity n=1 Tax=Ammoniphilus resinae TaxID=861532 RepID=A0ABS4GP16_9BACL|nr:NfeD family protein [Ammoniphilus resinae]MBP1932008.1 membrane protein implicated in regulation of membrane protease activity [Ammoniphilus resinae]